jgi:hypothetical protein
MNKKQRTMVVCGYVVILLMGLYPPWRLTITQPEPASPRTPIPAEWAIEVDGGYACLTYQPWTIPEARRRRSEGVAVQDIRVDKSLLLVQWFLVAATTGVIVMFLEDRGRSPADKPDE